MNLFALNKPQRITMIITSLLLLFIAMDGHLVPVIGVALASVFIIMALGKSSGTSSTMIEILENTAKNAIINNNLSEKNKELELIITEISCLDSKIHKYHKLLEFATDKDKQEYYSNLLRLTESLDSQIKHKIEYAVKNANLEKMKIKNDSFECDGFPYGNNRNN